MRGQQCLDWVPPTKEVVFRYFIVFVCKLKPSNNVLMLGWGGDSPTYPSFLYFPLSKKLFDFFIYFSFKTHTNKNIGGGGRIRGTLPMSLFQFICLKGIKQVQLDLFILFCHRVLAD